MDLDPTRTPVPTFTPTQFPIQTPTQELDLILAPPATLALPEAQVVPLEDEPTGGFPWWAWLLVVLGAGAVATVLGTLFVRLRGIRSRAQG